jgi:hypothetical protein
VARKRCSLRVSDLYGRSAPAVPKAPGVRCGAARWRKVAAERQAEARITFYGVRCFSRNGVHDTYPGRVWVARFELRPPRPLSTLLERNLLSNTYISSSCGKTIETC